LSTRWLAAGTLALLGPVALGAGLLVRGGTVWTGTGEALEGGAVLIRDGKVAAVGRDVTAPQGVRTIDVTGKHVCPGFVDPHSSLGLPTWEMDETVEAVAAEMPVDAAVWMDRPEVRDAVSSGVTTLVLAPGGANLLVGPCPALKLGPSPVLKAEAAIKVTVGPSALLWDRKPTSLPALLDMLRGALSDTEGPVGRLVAGGAIAQVACDGLADAERALGLIDGLHLKAALLLGGAPSRAVDLLAGRDLPVVLPSLALTPRDKFLVGPGQLAGRGVKVAFASFAPATQEADLRTSAALAVGAGMSPAAALRALTLGGAEAGGVADRVGSLEIGKDGDLVVAAREPLDLSGAIELVVVDGEIIYERVPQ